jgi:hypothetical protein
MSEFTNYFQDFLDTFTLKIGYNENAGTPNKISVKYNTREIQGISQPPSLYKRGSDIETEVSKDGNFQIGSILFITDEMLQLPEENQYFNIIVIDGIDYKVMVRNKITKLIEHYEYYLIKVVKN